MDANLEQMATANKHWYWLRRTGAAARGSRAAAEVAAIDPDFARHFRLLETLLSARAALPGIGNRSKCGVNCRNGVFY